MYAEKYKDLSHMKYKEHKLKETDTFRLAQDNSNRVCDKPYTVARHCAAIHGEPLYFNTQSGP
jgi:hypothetical protein